MNASTAKTRPRTRVWVLATAGVVAALMQTLVVPLIGHLPAMLDTTAADAVWAVTATLLAGAVATPVTGRLGDLYGKRRMLLVCCVPLITGSVICALAAGSLATMVTGRALQGMGMGVVALGISALRDLVPPDRVGSSIALISSSLGAGSALGLPFASVVAEHADWRILFWTAAGLSAVVALLIYLVIPATPVTATSRSFDYVGALGLGSGLVCLLLGVSKGASWGWTSPAVLILLMAAPLILGAWGWWELRTKAPLVDVRVTARPLVLTTNAASVIVAFAMYASSLMMPQLLQLPRETGHGLGQSMTAAGLWMAPAGLMMMTISPLGAKLSAATSPKVTLVSGSCVIALGYGISPLLIGQPWGVLTVACLSSSGVALAYGAMPALIMRGVPVSQTASANSFNTLLRSVGTTVAAAVMGMVLAQMTEPYGDGRLPTEAGFTTGLLLACGAALVAAAVALTIPLRKATPPAANPTQHS